MTRRQLTYVERSQISWFLAMDFDQKEIAEEIGFAESTISKEIRRNSRDNTYDPDVAQFLCDVRKKLPRKARVIVGEVEEFVIYMLKCGSVPEQISQLLKNSFGVKVSTTSIYNYIHHPFEGREDLAKELPRRKAAKKRKAKKCIERKANDNRVSIDKRPEEINQRERVGDLEIDTIISRGDKGGALTIVDRKALQTWSALIPDHKPSTVNKALLEILMPIKDRIHSITSDNGFEFRHWEEIAKTLECDYYFCHPYHSWERGTIENTNGIIRRRYPKGTNFNEVDEKEYQFWIACMNLRPRKKLGFITPDEVFFDKESFWKDSKVISFVG